MLLIRLIDLLSPLIAVVAGIYSFKHLDKTLKLIFAYSVAGICVEATNWLIASLGIKTNTPGLHFYIMFEFLLWALFYMHHLKGFINKKYIITAIVLFESYCIVNFLLIQNLFSYPFTRTIENLLLVFFSILLFAKIIVEAKIKKLALTPAVWLNSSVLLYFAGNFFYNIVFVYMLVADRVFLKTTGIYIFGLFNFLYYAGIAIGFFVQRKNSDKKLPARTR
ncbi:MAG TPA: hypothetical protein DER09_13375 [Prolixibacteraceae bacterium]|nr:hypothetical protein [Prolixibacteraceae bacterium]